MYSLPETIIHRDKLFVWISNFATLPITISKGQLLGYLADPATIYSTTSKLSSEDTPGESLEDVIDISKDLEQSQIVELKKVIKQNSEAFALDGKLGRFEEEVDIPMKGEVKPISIPPFPMSPANRATIDTQIDAWLQLEVIKPSRSPWAAPVFIVHRNSKPRW
jgi:hypothetical protein